MEIPLSVSSFSFARTGFSATSGTLSFDIHLSFRVSRTNEGVMSVVESGLISDVGVVSSLTDYIIGVCVSKLGLVRSELTAKAICNTQSSVEAFLFSAVSDVLATEGVELLDLHFNHLAVESRLGKLISKGKSFTSTYDDELSMLGDCVILAGCVVGCASVLSAFFPSSLTD